MVSARISIRFSGGYFVNAIRWIAVIRSFGYRLEPRYIFRAGRLDQ